MENSVIISSIRPRIDVYANAAGVTNTAIKKYIKNKMTNLETKITHFDLLNIKRMLQGFELAMGEKRTTEKMYLERDLKYIEDMESSLFSVDKNRGRNFVNTMRQSYDYSSNDELNNESSNKSTYKTLTKVNRDSNAYKIYSNPN